MGALEGICGAPQWAEEVELTKLVSELVEATGTSRKLACELTVLFDLIAIEGGKT